MIGSCREFNPQYRQNFSVGVFQDLSTLKDFNWIVSMVKSDLMDTYTITDTSCGSKSKWALVHLCTCKAAANRSNVYVSGKNNKKILPIPETMQGISTSAESKEEKEQKTKKNHLKVQLMVGGLPTITQDVFLSINDSKTNKSQK